MKTREATGIDDLLLYTSAGTGGELPLAWLRRGEGFVGAGSALTLPARSDDPDGLPIAERWRKIAAAAEIDDEVHGAGTGLVAFGSFAFDPSHSPDGGRLTVPRIIVGQRAGRTWVTTIHLDGSPDVAAPSATAYGPSWSASLSPGEQDGGGYRHAVGTAVAAIREGRLGKVVLARDLRGTVPAGADLRRLVRALRQGYPDTWVFAVDGLIGASPETLVTVSGGTMTARVLAGTTARGAGDDEDAAAEGALAASAKDLAEHRYAVQSVRAALAPFSQTVEAADTPFTLRLPNLWHLATDVAATLTESASALDLVAALHPTAAVAGAPTERALALIRELEPFDRGRFAGPVGWVNADGDGEWAIALRCAQLAETSADETIPVTAYAGAGIVADSDPETELRETQIKFRPIVDALA